MAHPFFCTLTGILFSLLCISAEANTVVTVIPTLTNLSQPYDGTPKFIVATTVPSGLRVSITYDGQTQAPTEAGRYVATATVTEPGYTGSKSSFFSITKITPTVSVPAISGKKLGAPPFQVTATASSGLPITRWESSDPSVAEVSNSGMVTLIGAGETTLIAVQNGGNNYNASNAGAPLAVALSDLPLPVARRELFYTGQAHAVDSSAMPSGRATAVSYRNVNAAVPTSLPEVIFQNGPNVLDLSYPSIGFSAFNAMALGKYVSLAGTARQLHSCDVTLVNWARYETTPSAWLQANPHLVVAPKPGISIPGDSGGYYHPITLSFYQFGNDGTTETMRLLMSKTINGFIPWRPTHLANGSTYPHNGYAFRAAFDFPEGFILPEICVVAVSYNTRNSGSKPIGIAGPYDMLNVANIPTTYSPKIGTTLFEPFTFWRQFHIWEGYTSNDGPMLRLRATASTAVTTPPIEIGTYEVKTASAAFPDQSSSTSLWVINKGQTQIDLSNTSHIFNGSQKAVAVTTQPPGIPTVIRYSGSPSAPSAVGRYEVLVEANHPNFAGTIRGFLTISDTFRNWQESKFAGSGVTNDQMADGADPNGDGLSNLMAYAANVNPVGASSDSIVKMEHQEETLSFIYRSNPLASDLVYEVEFSDDLTNQRSWGKVSPIEVKVLSDDGKTRVNEVKMAKPRNLEKCFMRLKVERNAPASY